MNSGARITRFPHRGRIAFPGGPAHPRTCTDSFPHAPRPKRPGFSTGVTLTQLADGYHRPHTYLRIAVTDRCNLRCTYCVPRDGAARPPLAAQLTLDDIARVARVFAGMGVRKIRLTGGEPLVRPDLAGIIRAVRAIDGIGHVGLTTNGTLLAEQASALREAGLTSVNISLDTLDPQRFDAIARRGRHADVLAGIRAALDAGFTRVKLNVVVMRGVNDDEIPAFVERTKREPLCVRFIEFMPFASNDWNEDGYVPSADILAGIRRAYDVERIDGAERGGGADGNPVAEEYRIPGHAGTIGFISPVSDHFCASCDRVRLTADGSVKSCLFSPAERSLLPILRGGGSDADLAAAVRDVLASKWLEHPPAAELRTLANRSMIRIGG